MTNESLEVGQRILIVDDDPGILRAVARILGRGHQVTCAASGGDATPQTAALSGLHCPNPSPYSNPPRNFRNLSTSSCNSRAMGSQAQRSSWAGNQ